MIFLMFMQRRYKAVVKKLIALHISHFQGQKPVYLYFVKRTTPKLLNSRFKVVSSADTTLTRARLLFNILHIGFNATGAAKV